MNRSRQNNLTNISITNRLQNANGKTVVAVVLVGVMAILWGRVLLTGKSGPANAAAQDLHTSELLGTPHAQVEKFLPVKLDALEGRHDVLCGDIFSANNWHVFDLKTDNQTEKVSPSQNTLATRHQANLEKIAANLKLEAIIRDVDGKPYQIYVNDGILTVGSVLTVKEGPEQYELELRRISENEAMFVWNETSITLKMTEMVEK